MTQYLVKFKKKKLDHYHAKYIAPHQLSLT